MDRDELARCTPWGRLVGAPESEFARRAQYDTTGYVTASSSRAGSEQTAKHHSSLVITVRPAQTTPRAPDADPAEPPEGSGRTPK